MRMTRLIPMLPVKSIAASIEFYGRLGFAVENRNDEWGWAMLRFDECRVMVDQSIDVRRLAPRQSALYLYPDDVVKYHEQVRAAGLAVPDLDVTFYGMTEFRIDDPDGNRWWIGQRTESEGPRSDVKIDGATEMRAAEIGDAAEMARLAGELGYRMSTAEMARRLAVLLPNERHHMAVFADGGRLLGWMHVEHRFNLEGGDRAELMGLVVDAAIRRRGVGKRLVEAAEAWTLARGLPSLTVRSNVARELSHPFYEALGYSRAKTQHVYRKTVPRMLE
jgi:GNAT superfamily N-acetyltransferase/uncharacterized glyoxalase superfamily protein PhnB